MFVAAAGAGAMLLVWLLSTQIHFVESDRLTKEEDKPWRFITLADTHDAEKFVMNPVLDDETFSQDSSSYKALKAIKENYGGELVLLPGDTNSGHWYKREFLDALDVDTPEEAVLKAGKQCYQSMIFMFNKAGYSTLLMAVGDHEVGDNPWKSEHLKTKLLPEYRQAFAKEFNEDSSGKFLYMEPIGKASSRPLGTDFEETSYAYRYKNVLFVTVDALKPVSSNFYDRKRGLGGQGAVTGTVDGEHLDWFEHVLSSARKDPTIRHILVQSHLPIMQPVRAISSSKMFMDKGENSPFFLAMRKYKVDVYFAGEVSHVLYQKAWRIILFTILTSFQCILEFA